MKYAITFAVALSFVLCPCACADPPTFKSKLFKTGKLVYSDNFDDEFNRERWGAPKKDKQINDGKLIVTAQFKSKEEATEFNCRTIALHSASPIQ